MSAMSGKVRHVVAWLPATRAVTCAALWLMTAAAWALPALHLPLRVIAPLGLAAAICHTLLAALAQLGRVSPPAVIGISLSIDAALMTGLLDLTGGPFNPFIVMYAVFIWLAVVAASPRWSAAVAAVSVAAFGWLIVDHVQAELAEHHRLNDFPTHLFTMWFSAAAIAELVAHYVADARAALEVRQRQVEEAREQARHSEHLASLTTLAAGAAHELSTPLATIAVAARELERSSERLPTTVPAAESFRADAALIRSEVERCQMILDGMSGRAPDGTPASGEPLAPAVIAQLAASRLTESQRRRLHVDIAADAGAPSVPGPAAVQAVSTLLRNAFDASGGNTDVLLRFSQRGQMVRVEVHDQGAGMAPDVQRRAGEPFFTTKEPGHGLGLGLFLTRSVAERAGGSLRFEMGAGTVAVLEVPLAGVAVGVQ
jgi:two-component system, sensor histidine kinase RegB